ncbi:MAG: phosphoglucosamine mutase, partial [Chloroflexota bacterium]|nr:phosphoglucosamine mutase [Chloroflexota bacterium]
GSLDSAGVVMSKVESQLLALKPESVSNTDGLKLGFSDGWLLIRPSGTEPKIRLTVEAKSETRVAELYNSGMQAIRNAAKEK